MVKVHIITQKPNMLQDSTPEPLQLFIIYEDLFIIIMRYTA
jgi:hypothetical protein